MKRFLYLTYLWLIAYPILMAATALTAIFTILFSPFPNTQVAYFPARLWGRIFCLFTLVRVKVTGLEHIDSKQSYVFICNHQSMFDVFVIYGWLPVFFKWMMKAELRKIPLVGRACEKIGHIFVDRKSPKSMKRSLEIAAKHLQNGVSVVVFPEGTRTSNGNLGSFKRGAFTLATDLKLPIIPITIQGAFECWKRSSANIHPGLIEVTIHPAVDVLPYLPNKQIELAKSCREIIAKSLST